MSHIEDASGAESIGVDRFGDEPALKKHHSTNNSTEGDPMAQHVRVEEEKELKRITELRDQLPNKLRYSGCKREIPLDRLMQDEAIQVRPLNSVYVEELERCMSEGLWDWKRTLFTVFTRSYKVVGRTHVKYVVQDGNHRFRAILQMKQHDPTLQVPKSINCIVYEELTSEECIILRSNQLFEEGVTLPLTVRDMASIVRKHLVRLGYTFSSAVKLYVKGVHAVRVLLPPNAPEFVIRMGCSCNVLYLACMRILECSSAGNIKLSPHEMTNRYPIYRFGKAEMFDLGRGSFWHAILIGYNKEPRRVLDVIEEIIGNRFSIIEAEEALRFYVDPLSEIATKMGLNSRREALEQLFGNADIDDSVIQTVFSDERIRNLCRRGSSVSISGLRNLCANLLSEVSAALRLTQHVGEIANDGMELISEVPLGEPGNCSSDRGSSEADRDKWSARPNYVVPPNVRSEAGNTLRAIGVDEFLRKHTKDVTSMNAQEHQRPRRASLKRRCTDMITNAASRGGPMRHFLRGRSVYCTGKRTLASAAVETEHSHEDANGNEPESAQSDSSQVTQFGGGATENMQLEAGSGEEETHIDGEWRGRKFLNSTSLDDLREMLEKEFVCRSHEVIDQFIQMVNRIAVLHKREMARKLATIIGELPTSTAEQLIADLRSLPKANDSLGVALPPYLD